MDSPLRHWLIIIVLCFLSQIAFADVKPSTTTTGTIGLNTVPSTRMNEKGTVRVGIGVNDPFTHTFMGFQFTDYLNVGIRQTFQSPKVISPLQALYPGMDLKLRLMKETRYRPEISLGFESALGHQQTASEYVAFSKRYKDFDFSGGIAWGRLGSAGHIKNPLGFIPHFDTERSFDANGSQGVRQWFTGKQIGFFGGVEYFTPLKGLSLKADYGADDYPVARLIDGFDAPAPWSIGLNYQPWEPIDLGVGIIGGDKIMARLSLQDQLPDWIGRPSAKQDSAPLRSPRPTDRKINKGPTRLSLTAFQPTGHQIGRAARLHADKMKPEQEEIILKLDHKGLKGPKVTLIRSDLENATLNKQSTPEEIWHDTEITENNDGAFSFKKGRKKNFFHLILENKLSLQQVETTPVFRSSLLIEKERLIKYGFLIGGRARLNITNSLGLQTALRTTNTNNIRSNEGDFADQIATIDRFYAGWLHSVNSNLHIAATAGHLEEMFSGYGAEILYRPFDKNYAVGAEFFNAQKRQPDTLSGLDDIDNNNYTTAHLNLFYEPPNSNLTFYGKAGRYLAGDNGVTLGVQSTFENGTKIEGYMTQTNRADLNLLGNLSNSFGGIRMTVPIGNAPIVPDGTEIRLNVEPFGRGTGQVLDRPLELYDVTEPISARHLQQSWHRLLD